jgi:hypothetical protein
MSSSSKGAGQDGGGGGDHAAHRAEQLSRDAMVWILVRIRYILLWTLSVLWDIGHGSVAGFAGFNAIRLGHRK